MTALAPCPGCGRTDPRVFAGNGYYRARCVCGWCAPTGTSVAEADAQWNRRAPALRWRREPPDVPGWWWQQSVERFPWLSHYSAEDVAEERRIGVNPSMRWAGPIPEPEEGGE